MKNRFTALLPAIFIFLTVLAGPVLAADEPCSLPVSTEQGLVRGKPATGAEVCTWKGIPYAAPPLGELRFRATQPPKTHPGILDSYEFGPACPQTTSPFSGGESQSYSEDCLTLNIWRPQKPGKYPVMVWIHGGAFTLGSGSYDMYNGAKLAELKDVVVVTINYRLGALGFLSLSELADEDPDRSTGNYGILDQVQALIWVNQNISQFGGDPGNVTIFGQSAGGMSVCTLLVSPLAKGLFQRAIPMSGACDVVGKKEAAYAQGVKLAKKLGCKDKELLACLRRKPAAAFLPKSTTLEFISGLGGGGLSYSPKLDGHVLTCQPLECIKQGNYNQVPVMIGFTRDEIRLFTSAVPALKILPKSMVNKLISIMTGGSPQELLKLYSYSDYKRPFDLFVAAATDFFCTPGFEDAEELSKKTPVYLYRFDWDQTKDPEKYGAFHGLDIPFVFGNDNPKSKISQKVRAKDTDAANIPLCKQIMAFYANFARTGDPNGDGLPVWPKYSVEKKERIYFNTTVKVAPISQKDLARYEFFAGQSRKMLTSGEK